MPLVVAFNIAIGLCGTQQLIKVTLRLLLHVHIRFYSLLNLVGYLSYLDTVIVIWCEVFFLQVHAPKSAVSTRTACELCHTSIESKLDFAIVMTRVDYVLALASKVNALVTTLINDNRVAFRALVELNHGLRPPHFCKVCRFIITVV